MTLEQVFVYDCSWNYRPDHCMYGSNCKPSESDGVKVLHGCRRVFHNDKEPSFKMIYSVFESVIVLIYVLTNHFSNF